MRSMTRWKPDRNPMPRTTKVDDALLLPFAKWLMPNITRRGYSVKRVADHAGMDVSHLHKIIKSYLPQYSEYQRPGYEKTVLIGELFDDVSGALAAADYPSAENTARESRIDYTTDPQLITVVEAFRGATETGKRGILTAAESARESSAMRAARAGAVGGKRAE